MNWFILTWNPSVWRGISDDEWDAFTLDDGTEVRAGTWSTGSRHHGIAVGDGLLFLRQGRDRGLLALGEATSEIYEGGHYNDPARTAWYVDYEWSEMRMLEDRVPTETLIDSVPGVPWNNLMGSGVQVAPEDIPVILALWSDGVSAWPAGVGLPPEDDGYVYVEGETAVVTTNRFERDPKSRAACIAAHGATCNVCGFDFVVRYGERGAGFVEVHHLTPLSEFDGPRAVDPIADLRPLCSNCHSMIHRGGLITPDELRALLR